MIIIRHIGVQVPVPVHVPQGNAIAIRTAQGLPARESPGPVVEPDLVDFTQIIRLKGVQVPQGNFLAVPVAHGLPAVRERGFKGIRDVEPDLVCVITIRHKGVHVSVRVHVPQGNS